MKRFFSLVLMLVCYSAFLSAGNRRHVIVLQDNSGSYYREKNNNSISKLQEDIISLFNNKLVNNDYNLLKAEREEGELFFNPNDDDVSFLWFVADQKGNVDFYFETDGDYRKFESYFFKKGYEWRFKKSNENITSFLRKNFSERPVNESQTNYVGLSTYSFSAYVYPLCLDVLDSDYTEEYVILIVSDFYAGSTFGNKQDEKIFRDAFKNKSSSVIERVNRLNAQFFKIAYFDYYLQANRDDNSIIGVTAFKLRPNVGNPRPENLELKLNSNIVFEQEIFGIDKYTMLPTEIVFNHNENLKIDSVKVICSVDNVEKYYEANITELCTYNEKENAYELGQVNDMILKGIKISSPQNKGDLKFLLNTSYRLSDESFVKYSFQVSSSFNNQNFLFKKQLSTMEISVIIFVIFLLVIIFIILLRKGKPMGIQTKFSHFNDNYESVDFSPEGNGRVYTDYKSWTINDETRGGFEIKVTGRLRYKKNGQFYNWQEQTGFTVRIYPILLKCPQGFEAYVSGGGKMSNDRNMPIELEDAFSDNSFRFSINIRKISNTSVVDILPFSLVVEIYSLNNGLRKFNLRTTVSYDFHVGPQLGNVWLGLDPGTTGSCIAIATDSTDLTIEKDEDGKDVISPSVISINSRNMVSSEEDEIRNNARFGNVAASIRRETETLRKFVSIKKLIGYEEVFSLGQSKTGENLLVKSSFLSTLMIEGLMKQHQKYIEKRRNDYPQFFDDGVYDPKRAVIAIPNNFTTSKLQQLKECVMNVKDSSIKELRFIYEAEAILVNYINSELSNEKQQESSNGETIFIFDMGGATINATIANVKRRNHRNDWTWDIQIISKLGYGVGGDTIDYAYLKWIYSKKDYYNVLAENDPFGKNRDMSMAERRMLKDAVLDLKKQTIRSYYDNSDNLIESYELGQFNGYNLNLGEKNLFEGDIRNDSNSFLHSEFFEKFVYGNVDSIVDDIMTICKEKNIVMLDTVLMSGRSSHFPGIKERVSNGIETTGYTPHILLLDLQESKTAVAKGACYYGIQSSRIILHNMTSNGVFGVIQKLQPTQKPIFHTLILDGENFDEDGNLFGSADINAERGFTFDGKRVKFCQVMGVNPKAIIANEEKHKYSEIAALPVNQLPVKSVQITITNKDRILCAVTDENGDVQPPVEALLKDSDIMVCNDEQYTFFVKQS